MRSQFAMVESASKGASLLLAEQWTVAFDEAIASAILHHAIGGVLLVHLSGLGGGRLSDEDSRQAACIFGQLARQKDVIAVLQPGLLGVVFRVLERRADASVMLDRFQSFAQVAELPYRVHLGMSVFPFSGATQQQLLDAAHLDLRGALSSETWEHMIPHETLITPAPV